MTLEQLRIFIAVAEREHVTQAARDLNLTQSATSAAISALETRHQTKLFDRIGRRIVLTEAGRIFLGEARAVIARAEAAETVLTDLSGLKRGSLRLAASQTVANYWLPRIMAGFRVRYPGIALVMTIGNTETVAEAINEGSADLGFIEGEVYDPALAIEPVADDQMILVVAAGHPWAATRPVPHRDFKTARWVFREQGSGTRAIFEAALPALGVDRHDLVTALELPSNEAVLAAVEAGAGVAVMSRLVAENSLSAGLLATVDIDLPKRRFLALRHKERYVTRAANAFRSFIGEINDTRKASSRGNARSPAL